LVLLGGCAGTAAMSQAAAPAHPHLAVDLTVAPAEGRMSVIATVRPGPVSTNEELGFVLARSMTVEGIDAGTDANVTIGESVRPWTGLQRVGIRFTKAQSDPQITFRYQGRPAAGGDLPINMITSELVELSLDGMWIPIREDLAMRFTADTIVRGLPAGYSLVAQGQQTRTGDSIRVVRPHPDLDLALIASPRLRARSGRGVELYAGDPAARQPAFFFDHSERALQFLQEWLGPVPAGPVRVVVVSRPRKSGYARIGLIVLVESEGEPGRGTAGFVAHELAHLWFSNANAADEHRWLDESIAEYSALRYVEFQFGAEARDALLVRRRERVATARAVVGTNRNDLELYGKGPLLLMELEQRVGRPVMDNLIRQVAQNRVSTTAEFLGALSRLASADAAAWFANRLST
jgi:hypothetical protein